MEESRNQNRKKIQRKKYPSLCADFIARKQHVEIPSALRSCLYLPFLDFKMFANLVGVKCHVLMNICCQIQINYVIFFLNLLMFNNYLTSTSLYSITRLLFFSSICLVCLPSLYLHTFSLLCITCIFYQ